MSNLLNGNEMASFIFLVAERMSSKARRSINDFPSFHKSTAGEWMKQLFDESLDEVRDEIETDKYCRINLPE